MFPIWSDINLCFGLFVLNHDQSGIWLCNLCFWNPDPNDRVIFIISCSWLPCPVGWLTETSWSTVKQSKLPNVLFSKTQISSHLFEISLKLTIICYINLIKSAINKKNGWINISCTVIFLRNEISFRNKSQWLSACQNISYQFLNTGLSAWNIIPASRTPSWQSPPNPLARLTWMPYQPGRIQGNYRNGNGKRVW
jgi:hypothetical protein